MAAARGSTMADKEEKNGTDTNREENKVVADKDVSNGRENGDEKSEGSVERIVAETAAISDETDKEPLLGFESLDQHRMETNVVQAIIKKINYSNEEHKPMDLDPAPTRKRKGEPMSLSSLSDEKKKGSDSIDSASRPIRPTINKRKITVNDGPEEDTLLSKHPEDGTTKAKNKFWKDNAEETQTASSDEGQDSLMGQRRRMGAPRKKKKKGQNKENDKEERKKTGEGKFRSLHETKPSKLEGRKYKKSSGSELEEPLKEEKYGHMAASAAGALAGGNRRH